MLEKYFRRLHLASDADTATIRAAYVRMVRRYPPEHFPEQFAEIQAAWQALSLTEDFIQQMSEHVLHTESPVELGAVLWPCHLAPVQPFPDFTDVLEREAREKALDAQLSSIADKGIVWRTV